MNIFTLKGYLPQSRVFSLLKNFRKVSVTSNDRFFTYTGRNNGHSYFHFTKTEVENDCPIMVRKGKITKLCTCLVKLTDKALIK